MFKRLSMEERNDRAIEMLERLLEIYDNGYEIDDTDIANVIEVLRRG